MPEGDNLVERAWVRLTELVSDTGSENLSTVNQDAIQNSDSGIFSEVCLSCFFSTVKLGAEDLIVKVGDYLTGFDSETGEYPGDQQDSVENSELIDTSQVSVGYLPERNEIVDGLNGVLDRNLDSNFGNVGQDLAVETASEYATVNVVAGGVSSAGYGITSIDTAQMVADYTASGFLTISAIKHGQRSAVISMGVLDNLKKGESLEKNVNDYISVSGYTELPFRNTLTLHGASDREYLRSLFIVVAHLEGVTHVNP